MLKKLLQVLLNIANYCAPSTDPSALSNKFFPTYRKFKTT